MVGGEAAGDGNGRKGGQGGSKSHRLRAQNGHPPKPERFRFVQKRCHQVAPVPLCRRQRNRRGSLTHRMGHLARGCRHRDGDGHGA